MVNCQITDLYPHPLACPMMSSRDSLYTCSSELHMTFPERAVSIISITIPLTLKVSEHTYMNCDIANSSLAVIVYISHLQITNPDNAVILSDAQIKVRERVYVELYTKYRRQTYRAYSNSKWDPLSEHLHKQHQCWTLNSALTIQFLRPC